MTPPTVSKALQGRVFDLWRHFQALPRDLQTDVTHLQTHLLSPDVRNQVFGSQTDANSFPKASGDAILRAIQHQLEQDKSPNKTQNYATKVADGLIQNGFLTPQKHSKLLENFDFQAKDSTFLGSKIVYVFDSDVALQTLEDLELSTDATVEFNDEMQYGIKLSNAKSTEVFAAESKEKQEEWLNSFINAGAQYREVFNVEDTNKIKSFYELKDFDMAGNEVPMSNYKGKVVLAVNVSSKCGLTPTNYPELQQLYEKYKDEGLEILAFPCNQFAGQEPGTHEEIMEFVKQYNVTFPFFEKHDVNGATARPVFTYLKTKLPGSFGSFVKWNFTKFLVDRNGQPYKRFAPKDLPFSFEEDIKTLLAQKSTDK
ncbi:hypothetical protein JM18_005985 [Phytophthora kernoviae]|uniref:Glutathione peroxidase n=1 Tax=Phytophthora kernoviae TaxID=325452 RepID=A0A8T0LS33_9STRA|nr:hypothetical protein JM16_005853 [Phytophthora kernoviae]KAG2521284.1 hypothetical protein JM18_005985 [Phytophthora kernoviae]